MKIKNPAYFGKLLHERGFKTWVLYMFKVLEKKTFIVESLHDDLFEEFQDIYDGIKTRENINIPPRSGKTALAKYFIAYALAVNPKCEFIYTSFSQDLLNTVSNQLAAILQNPKYKSMYRNGHLEINDFEVDPVDEFWQDYLKDSENKDKYTARKIVTKEGGIILFSSIGSTITGFGCGVRGSKIFSGALFIDDGNKPSEIRSELKRQKAVIYFDETLLTRLNDSHIPIANIQQRLHLEDLSGVLAAQYGFNTLKRALLVDGVCQLPSQYTPERIIELQVNEFKFVSQYQQEPVLEGGNLFKREVIRELTRDQMPTAYDYAFITADLSYKDKESNDFTVFSYWRVLREFINGIERNHLYLVDVKRRKINSVEVDNWIDGWVKEKLTYGFRYIWIEDKSHGIYLNQAYRKKGYPVPDEELLKDTLPRSSDKVTRANNIIPCLNSINPNLTICIDIEDYNEIKSEVLAFPNSKHDDFVDTLIDAARIALLETQVSILDVL